MNVTAIIKRTSIVAVVAVASVFAAGPVFADSYTTVKIYHTTSKPLALIHAVDSYFLGYAGHRDYRDYGKHRDYDKHREYGKYRGKGKHRGHSKHDNYRGHALWARPSQSYHGYHAPTRGSWSSGEHREKVRYNRHGRDSHSYRRTERSSVIIRQRSR